ncbi:hypothetical protein [Saccharothrix syringae]|uniref:Uncharacterized protein n=1 Tax=Saccharothrix syringae TaxID=103733 RepID=A0A5Q0GSU7_SACSY|nr:hypothetical protein [Saccharothrix syringae]QFZ17058.1 hypothetical protein EKG83_05855 [Saccharothrix syringae]
MTRTASLDRVVVVTLVAAVGLVLACRAAEVELSGPARRRAGAAAGWRGRAGRARRGGPGSAGARRRGEAAAGRRRSSGARDRGGDAAARGAALSGR